MKKIAFASILALAFTSFACDDSDKDDPVIDNPNELEKKFKEADKALAKKIIECNKSDQSASLDPDMLEEFQAKVNGTESYNYLKTKPYRNCLAEMLSYNECDSKQECSVLLKYYASDDVGSEDHGKCKSFYDAYTSCMSNEANMPSDVEVLCTSKLSCPKADQELTVDELVQCAQEDENLKDANCRTAKSTYFKCLTANGASVCTSLEANACADEKAAEASACNP